MSMQNCLVSDISSFGTHQFGAQLHIDYQGINTSLPVAIDCETDEKDGFVGLAICYDPKNVYYYTKLTESLKMFIETATLIGHNLKADAHWLKQWGCTIQPSLLADDTMLMSYVRDNARDSHGLKELAQELLGMNWPSYKEMVGKGKNKLTLDKQEVVKVANYCGCDALATWKLCKYFQSKMNPARSKFYHEHEMPLMRILYEVENKGIILDVKHVEDLKASFDTKFVELQKQISNSIGYKPTCNVSCPKKVHAHEFNPSSPKQVKEALKSLGVQVKSTDKSVLKQYTHVPFVSLLLEYKKIAKVKSTYIDAFLEIPTLPYIHSTFNQVSYDTAEDSWQGIRTGRLSSSNPNMQNIPSPKDEKDQEDIGALVRSCFIPTPGNVMVCADYSQIEYRLLGHFTQEPLIVEAYKDGIDIHEATGKAIGANRKLGKTINFAAIYGAGPAKVAKTVSITPEEAKGFLDAYWKKLPRVTSWIKRVKINALLNGGVTTLGGRWIPLPAITTFGAYQQACKSIEKINATRAKRGDRPFTVNSLAQNIKSHNERVAVNATIQGSAADIIRMAMIYLKKDGIIPNLQVHDELLFDISPRNEELFMQKVVNLMTLPYKQQLRVPLKVSINTGSNWEEAK